MFSLELGVVGLSQIPLPKGDWAAEVVQLWCEVSKCGKNDGKSFFYVYCRKKRVFLRHVLEDLCIFAVGII